MRDYVLVELSSFNNKKQKEYDKFIGKNFSMNDKLYLGLNVSLNFKDKVIKSKLESISKEKEVNSRKRFIMVTSDFTAIIQLKEAFDKEN